MTHSGKSAMRQQNNLKSCCCLQALFDPNPICLVLLPQPLYCLWQLADSGVELIQLTNALKKGVSNIPPGGNHLDLSCHTWAVWMDSSTCSTWKYISLCYRSWTPPCPSGHPQHLLTALLQAHNVPQCTGDTLALFHPCSRFRGTDKKVQEMTILL